MHEELNLVLKKQPYKELKYDHLNVQE